MPGWLGKIEQIKEHRQTVMKCSRDKAQKTQFLRTTKIKSRKRKKSNKKLAKEGDATAKKEGGIEKKKNTQYV